MSLVIARCEAGELTVGLDDESMNVTERAEVERIEAEDRRPRR
jgi:hypothetical protein